MTMDATKRIAVIGGGPGGLTLARLLQRHGFNVTVYERDTDRKARPQGGTLDLHEESGQRAIREMGLEHEFLVFARPEGQETRVLDKQGRILWEEQPNPEEMSRPEIDRSDLRDLLLHSLLLDTILWGAHVTELLPLPGEQWLVVTKEGGRDTYDLVVGCEGAFAYTRTLLSPATPAYSGVTYVETGIPAADVTAPEVAALVGNGTLFALGDAKALITQRNAGGYIRLYAALAVEEEWARENAMDFVAPSVARTALLHLFADWGANLRQIIEATEDRFVLRPLYRLPLEHRWQTRPGLTLLGDAAHLMTPFAGQGANLAMLDAVDLMNCLTSPHFASLTEALSAFETSMQDRAAEAARETQHNQELCFGPDAAERFARQMQSYQQ